MSDEAEWVLVGLDEKVARRQGVPPHIPVPKGEMDGLADTGLEVKLLRKWITAFLGTASPAWRHENAALAKSFERFISKIDLWTRAQDAFAKRDFPSAIATLKLVAKIDPDDHAAKMNLGSALASTGDHAGAIALLESIRATFEGEPDYHTTLGQLHAAAGARDAATDELVLALEAKGDHQPALDALRELGVLVAIYENPRDAASLTYVRADAIVEYLESVWASGPRDVAYYLDQIAYHAKEERHAVVLAAAERAEKQAPDDRLEAARVSALRALGRPDDALAAARAFVTRAPTSAGAHVELARALLAKGEAAEARRGIDEALRLDPGNLMALDLAFWPADRGNLELIGKAVAALRAFADAHPQVAGPLRTLARAKIEVGAVDEGLALFAEAVLRDKDDDDLRCEYWTELGRQGRMDAILADAAALTDMAKRDWKLRWNEAEAFGRTGKKSEARTAFTALNHDTSLHVDIRRRAKRQALALDQG